MSLPAIGLMHSWDHWKSLWVVSSLSLILASVWGHLNAHFTSRVGVCEPWPGCIWHSRTGLSHHWAASFVGNNSSLDWRRWGLEVRAFMWEEADLRHSSQGKPLCVAWDTITHFLPGILAIFAGSNYCRGRKDLSQGLPDPRWVL